MKSFIGRRPPGWSKRPDQPVIIVAGEEEKTIREHLYAFSDLWRKVRRRADQILNRDPWAIRVDICNAKGEVLRTVNREPRVEIETGSKEARSDREQKIAVEKTVSPEPLKKTVATSESKKRGRPPGKRSNPGYTQITAYVRTRTINDVKVKLIKQGSKQDASELIEELLSAWLQKD
ncbi:MAG: hypothetical protein HONDAALG_02616 [Gammaproteobacteria bacterium]|nr:hypothetical protein [Gammaproteobacteria bacterium]